MCGSKLYLRRVFYAQFSFYLAPGLSFRPYSSSRNTYNDQLVASSSSGHTYNDQLVANARSGHANNEN